MRRSALTGVTFAIAMVAACPALGARDWSDPPWAEDNACEFGMALWTQETSQRHRLRAAEDYERFAFQRAAQRCRNGMILLISSGHSGGPPTQRPTDNIARSLCRVEDIVRTSRPAIDKYFFTDFRCPIAKLPAPTQPPASGGSEAK